MLVTFSRLFNIAALSLALIGLSACNVGTTVGPLNPGAGNSDNWSQTVASARNRLSQDPNSSEARTGLLSAIQGAEDHYIQLGRDYLIDGDVASAEGAFSRGLLVTPESEQLRSELEGIENLKLSQTIMNEGRASLRAGNIERAVTLLERALEANPDNRDALALLNQAYGSAPIHTAPTPIRLRSSSPVTVNFREADMKEAFLTLGRNYGLNTIFDSGLQDRDITIYAERVSFDQAFNLMLQASGTRFRKLNDNSVLIYADTPEARAENEDYHVRTFYLEAMPAEQIRQLIEQVLDVRTVTANADNNSVTLRATRDKIALAERLIRANDRRVAEVSLEVEILEVNRTKSENLGVDFGSQITISPPQTTVGGLFDGTPDLSTSVVSLPATSIRFFKQDVDARTLASPRIRTLSRRPATIHIGDRVPLRSATVLDANGQSSTSFEYRDVGIKLQVTPRVLLDNSVEVLLKLEVSSLGQNLGTTDESAFSIGTRNVETNMILHDSETAIIGGLIRDEERVSTQRVPGLGDIPVVGRLFQIQDGQGTRTDILLTLTPRIVQGWDVPSPADTDFFSGTGANVTSQNEFSFMSDGAPGGAVIRLDLDGSGSNQNSRPVSPVETVPASVPAVPTNTVPTLATSATTTTPSIGFNRSIFEVPVDSDGFSIPVLGSGLSQQGPSQVRIRFNKEIIEIRSADRTGNSSASFTISNAEGYVDVTVAAGASGEEMVLGTMQVVPISAGLSYLTLEGVEGAEGVAMDSARVVVR